MHINVLISILIIQSSFPLSNAFANNGLTGGVEVGHGIFWAYGLVFAALIGFIIYRRWDRRRGTPEQRSLRLQLKELNRALDVCLKKIKNADEYPNECGLSDEKRRKELESAKSIQSKIGHTKEILSAT
jgi:hypothetical protein